MNKYSLSRTATVKKIALFIPNQETMLQSLSSEAFFYMFMKFFWG